MPPLMAWSVSLVDSGSHGAGPPAPVEVLIERRRIQTRVGELAECLARDLTAGAGAPVFVGVLKGSTVFLADLVRALHLDVIVDFMSISAYGSATDRPESVRIVKDLDDDIAGRHVVLVEDIVDTGLTLNFLTRMLAQRRPRSFRVVTLLDRSVRRIAPVEPDYVGFQVSDLFVVGYGLDFKGSYRNLPDIVAITDLARLARHPLELAGPLFVNEKGDRRC